MGNRKPAKLKIVQISFQVLQTTMDSIVPYMAVE
jgi:hypothetical protein